MEIESHKSETDGLENLQMKSNLQHLHGEINKKTALTKNYRTGQSVGVEMKVTEGEKNSSKDYFIFEKMPVQDPKQLLSHQVLDLLN